MSPDVVLNFALTFEVKFASELVTASQSFREIQKLDYSLGENSLPHVTILQFAAPLSEAERCWSILSPIRQDPILLDFHGLAFDRWRSWDGLWLRIKFNPQLRAIQSKAMQLLGDRAYVNSTGAMYEPHTTLAAWSSKDHLPALKVPTGILDRKSVSGIYSLGTSGPQFQFEHILFSGN